MPPRRRSDRCSIPASTTTNGCSVSGTGVPGSGTAICDASASAIAAIDDADRAAAGGPDGESQRGHCHFPRVTESATASPPPRQSVARPVASFAILQRVQ